MDGLEFPIIYRTMVNYSSLKYNLSPDNLIHHSTKRMKWEYYYLASLNATRKLFLDLHQVFVWSRYDRNSEFHKAKAHGFTASTGTIPLEWYVAVNGGTAVRGRSPLRLYCPETYGSLASTGSISLAWYIAVNWRNGCERVHSPWDRTVRQLTASRLRYYSIRKVHGSE